MFLASEPHHCGQSPAETHGAALDNQKIAMHSLTTWRSWFGMHQEFIALSFGLENATAALLQDELSQAWCR